LRVSRAERRVFDGTSDAALHPDLGVFLADLVRPYGFTLRDDLLARGSGHSYGEMGEALLGAVLPTGQPVDLIVLAFAMPDIWPERATASYLSHLCPGDPMAFAICDQGTAAAFTGLRLAREYARTDGCRRALLLIVEQAALHYQPALPHQLVQSHQPVQPHQTVPHHQTASPYQIALPHQAVLPHRLSLPHPPTQPYRPTQPYQPPVAVDIPARHAAVALLCDESGAARLDTVRQHAGVGLAQVATLLSAELADLAAGRTDVTLVIGRDLACLGADTTVVDEVRVAPAGQPSTAVWWELAGGLPTWTAQGRLVLLAEYDQALRYLCVSAIDAGATPQPSQPQPSQPQPGVQGPFSGPNPPGVPTAPGAPAVPGAQKPPGAPKPLGGQKLPGVPGSPGGPRPPGAPRPLGLAKPLAAYRLRPGP